MLIKDLERQDQMVDLHNKGLSYEDIGSLFKVSRARSHQIISGYGRLNRALKNGWYHKIVEVITERDDHKCQRCGSNQSLIVHHSDGNDRNNNFTNLVALCRSCHQLVHLGKVPLICNGCGCEVSRDYIRNKERRKVIYCKECWDKKKHKENHPNNLGSTCPYCHGNRIVKRGFTKRKLGMQQCYVCKDCRRVFSHIKQSPSK